MSWEWREKEGIPYIYLPQWEAEGVNVGFSTRWGGVSAPPYSSMNLGLHVGDRKEDVMENRRRWTAVFDGKISDMVCCEQVHGRQIGIVKRTDRGRGAYELESVLPGLDGMICNEAGMLLAAFFADCLPIYFFDPHKRVIGIAHAGWKGTLGRIAASTVTAMEKAFASKPQNIWVFLGPGIKACCFVIQDDLVEKVYDELREIDGIISNKNGRLTWDLRLTNRRILLSSGIREKNIIDCDLCTSCHLDKFFSYRNEQSITGRMCAIIGLKR
ncbi:MAG: peptidoglycan editing factor PgeF [Syntrophomonadaceae bacterium]|jgi:YfiH family protein